MTDQSTVRSLDDPNIFVEQPATIFDAVPPYPPRTEREAEFYDLRDGEMLINLGPQHPSTHGVLRVVLKIDGEKVTDLDPVLGYLHRGVEKLCEVGDWHIAINQCDPLEYVASMFSEAMPVLAAEKLLDLQVPPRAEYIRTMAWELNRIASHGLFLGWLALDLGGLTPLLYGFIERDEIVEMLASLTTNSPKDVDARLRLEQARRRRIELVSLLAKHEIVADLKSAVASMQPDVPIRLRERYALALAEVERSDDA